MSKSPSTSQAMHRAALALACLACMGHSRRAPSAPWHLQGLGLGRSFAGEPDLSAPLAQLLQTLNPPTAFIPSSAAAHTDARFRSRQRLTPSVYMGAGSADRRKVLATGVAAALTALLPPEISLAKDPKTKDEVREKIKDTAAKLKAILAKKEAFIEAYSNGMTTVQLQESGLKMPEKIRLDTFRILENDADPEFMDGAAGYLEAVKSVKDYLRLAALTKQEVEVVKKDKKGKVVSTEKMKYGDNEQSGLGSAKEYAESAYQDILGASVCLDAVVKYMN